jgi:hypothetical protein
MLVVDDFIMRCGAEFGELRQFLVFHINNYQTLLAAWGDYAPGESQDVERRLQGWRKQYVEEVLSPSLGAMQLFVSTVENQLANPANLAKIRVDKGTINPLHAHTHTLSLSLSQLHLCL